MDRLYEFNNVFNLDEMLEENRLYYWEKTKISHIIIFLVFIMGIYCKINASTPDENTMAILMLFSSIFGFILFFVSLFTRPKMVKKQYEMLQMKNNAQRTYRFSDKIYLINQDVEKLDDNIVKELEKFGIEKEKTISYKDIKKIKKYKNCIILYLNNNLYIPLREKNIVLGNWDDCHDDLKKMIEPNRK